MLVSGVLTLALGITAVSLPVPYVIESPGPTFNTLGEDRGEPVISVSGTEVVSRRGQPGPHYRLRGWRTQRARQRLCRLRGMAQRQQGRLP